MTDESNDDPAAKPQLVAKEVAKPPPLPAGSPSAESDAALDSLPPGEPAATGGAAAVIARVGIATWLQMSPEQRAQAAKQATDAANRWWEDARENLFAPRNSTGSSDGNPHR